MAFARLFIQTQEFPFFIQYWVHIGNMLMHSHKDFSELVLVTEGSARHIVDNESYVISKGGRFCHQRRYRTWLLRRAGLKNMQYNV